MSILFLILAGLSGVWFLLAYGLAETHPAPSQTTLIPQIVFAFFACPVCLVIALIAWLFGG